MDKHKKEKLVVGWFYIFNSKINIYSKVFCNYQSKNKIIDLYE